MFTFRSMSQTALLVLATGMAAFEARATGDSGSEQAFFLELPVVLTASRLTQPLDESPNAMTVIDQQMIRASGFRKLSELFRLVPGMYVGSRNGYSGFVSYHGTTDDFARRMQVLVDGRSVYLPPFSSVTWDNIPVLLEDIERIEVIRGPSAASHGANSTQGVINIITREAGVPEPGRVTVAQGGNGVSDLFAQFGVHGDSLDQRIGIGYRADQGFDWSLVNDNNRTNMLNWRGNYHPNGVDNFDIQFGYSAAVRADGVANRADNPFRDTRSEYSYQQLSWTRALEAGDELRVAYHHTYWRFDDDVVSPAEKIRSQRHDVELQHIAQWHPDNRMAWGAGWRSESVSGPVYFDTPVPALNQIRLFAHDEWRFSDRALLNVGAMWEDDGMRHREVSPRLSLNYHVTPTQTLRASTSVAYRSPATLEEYGNTPVTVSRQMHAWGGLRPEKLHSREIGYLGQFPGLGLSLDARVYADRLSDLIFIDPICNDPATCGTAYNSFKNYIGLDLRGWESTLKYQWAEHSMLTLNYARQMIGCGTTGMLSMLQDPAVIQPVKDYLNGELQNLMMQCPKMVPTNSGSLLVDHSLDAELALSAGYYFQDEVQVLDAIKVQRPMHRVDIKITRSFGKRDEAGGGEVALVMQNLFRDTHTEYASIPQQGEPVLDRRAYLLATFRY
jgi:iron complex outermembrane receptor protein